MRPSVGLQFVGHRADNSSMDATYIARKTAGLTGFDLAAAYGELASEVAAQVGTGTLDTDGLLKAVSLHTWLRDAQAHTARNA